MSYHLPRGHLSPSQLTAYELCEMRYKTFNAEGHKAPPDFALHAKIKTHEVILEKDLAQKIESGKNLANSDLSEIYRAEMEQAIPLAKEDPNLEGEAVNVIGEEIAYFDKIIAATQDWRHKTSPIGIEKEVNGLVGDVPVSGRIDLIADEPICNRIVDLKRQGSAAVAGSAGKNRQLVTYSILEGLTDVALAVVVENKTPVMKPSEGEVSVNEQRRVTAQYRSTAEHISLSMEKDIWKPVDHGDPRKAWVCSAKFCGAWRSDARDWVTGVSIACPYGERSQVTVGAPEKIFGLTVKEA